MRHDHIHDDAILAVIAAAPAQGLTRGNIREKTGLHDLIVGYALKRMVDQVHRAGRCVSVRYFRCAEDASAYEQMLTSDEARRERMRANWRRSAAKRRAAEATPGREQVRHKPGETAPVKVAPVATTRAFREAPAVVPKHVVVQTLPGFRGDRFAPEAGFVGEFTAEWRRARETEAA